LRYLDIIFSVFILALSLPLIVLVTIVLFFQLKYPIFSQRRLGKNMNEFTLYKFRTMPVGTKSIGSHLLRNVSISRFGHFLRKYKIDELPQLLNVLKGDMSLVGPRPCLPNQFKVISQRQKRLVFSVKPGITGRSQLMNIDMSMPVELAVSDSSMIDSLNISMYLKYLFLTALGNGNGDRILE